MAVTPSRPPLQPAAQFEPGVLFRLLDDVAAYKQRYEEITATAAKLQKQSDDLHAERFALDKAKEEYDARDADLAKREAAAKAAEEAIVKKRGDALAQIESTRVAAAQERAASLKAIEDRTAALDARDAESAKHAAAVSDKAKELSTRESVLAADEATLDKRRHEIAARDDTLSRNEEAYRARVARLKAALPIEA